LSTEKTEWKTRNVVIAENNFKEKRSKKKEPLLMTLNQRSPSSTQRMQQTTKQRTAKEYR
jgi:hypothetical protein